jgi:CrcB protein
MFEVLLVGIGGFIGAISRYLISNICNRMFGNDIPFGTLVVNVIGALLIGFIMEVSLNKGHISPNVRIFLTTGILGGLTTFSTFSYETVAMFSEGKILFAVCNAAANLILCLVFVFVGKALASMI